VDGTWNLWQSKLAEFSKWSLRRRSILEKLYAWYLLRQLLKDIPSEFNGAVLDVGCGSGTILRAIAQGSLTTAIGVDPLLETSLNPFLQKARERNLSSLHPLLAVGERLPIRNESVCFCLVVEALDHVANSKCLLTEIHRVLANNGQLLVEQHIREDSRASDMQHLRNYSEDSLVEELRESGFIVVKKRNLAEQLLKFPLSALFNLGRKYYLRHSDKEFDTTDAFHGELVALATKA